MFFKKKITRLGPILVTLHVKKYMKYYIIVMYWCELMHGLVLTLLGPSVCVDMTSTSITACLHLKWTKLSNLNYW